MTAPSSSNMYPNRESWLEALVARLDAAVFRPAGYQVPRKLRIACGFPSKGGLAPKKRVLGQAWDPQASADGHHEILISPNVDAPEEVARIVTHELVHTAVGVQCGHRGDFRRCALAIGLQPPMTQTPAGEAFKRAIAPILEELGPYPHARLGSEFNASRDPVQSSAPKPDRNRQMKAQCDDCGLVMRLTRKWITGKRLCCPDMDCPGHQRRLSIG